MEHSLTNWTYQTIDAKNGQMEPPVDLREKIAGIKGLPPLPGIAAKILKLSNDPSADGVKLAKIIELDPLLTTQVIRWASSALYGYKGKITSVEVAINRVLGYQFVFNLALSLSVLKPLKAPKEGAIGTAAFWRHALASTHLMKHLNDRLPESLKIESQTVFFVAIMHNIGLPLLGDQFINEFKIFNKIADANPNLSQVKLEKFVFGVDHCELGCWLLRSWAMPKSVIDVVYHHHNPNYKGDNVVLNQLTYLNDILLAGLGIGDGFGTEDYQQTLEVLQLEELDCQQSLQKVSDQLEGIQSLVSVCLSGN